MPKIPGISPDQAVRVFGRLGYQITRQGRHIVMSNGITRLVIPRHTPINAYTMGAIARDADLSPQDFKKLL
ncbi:MAG: type II toxin-antitoxin system HicA family toxin [Planctomycetes bacterium]|nr:type II toxin-antitoxin system HicA family toxin [Planctomycetota bacterium]MBU4398290.1 type II toxin-antitoxin system HicA family toxin [Planctomycetota bacterium]MCG2684541.1 type II toxin-antitoxin system HicA family toxin [Planctomycetales bacterium]